MIKTALKHWIYELCIDQIFDNINNNFMSEKNKVEIGRKYKHLTVTNKRGKHEFWDCEILRLFKDKWCDSVVIKYKSWYKKGLIASNNMATIYYSTIYYSNIKIND